MMECRHGNRHCADCYCETDRKVRALEAEVARLKKDNEEIGDRAWNHAITRTIGELNNMKIEDARRLALRIRALLSGGNDADR